jgi:hypothetical protein
MQLPEAGRQDIDGIEHDGNVPVKHGFALLARADHPADSGSLGLAVGDVDNDGNIDIY